MKENEEEVKMPEPEPERVYMSDEETKELVERLKADTWRCANNHFRRRAQIYPTPEEERELGLDQVAGEDGEE